MGKPFSLEVAAIPDTIKWALAQDISLLARTLEGVSDKNLVVVGSGGSFSAACYLSQLHELMFFRLSRPCTPLEYRLYQKTLTNSATVLLSAEGKNNDILAAAEWMTSLQASGLSLTLTESNPLHEFCKETGVATSICFNVPWGKDGYLATNSLIFSMIIFARAYSKQKVDNAIVKLDNEWLETRRKRISESGVTAEITSERTTIVLYGSVGKVAAIDLESKFSEAALGTCQPVDYRQFAHGRHLQLIQSNKPIIIAFDSDIDKILVDNTLKHIPSDVPVLRLSLPTSSVLSEIIGVIDGILLIESIGNKRFIDVGQPNVPQLSREIHALDIRRMFPRSKDCQPLALNRKLPITEPSEDMYFSWEKAALDFCERLSNARFKAIVCDFDGTCCDTDRRFYGLDSRVQRELSRLISEGIFIGFATGRGDSLHTNLREKLNPQAWPNILVGYYSGSVLSTLNHQMTEPVNDKRLDALATWLEHQELFPSINSAPKICGGQLSLQIQNQSARFKVANAINYWISEQSASGWRVFFSGHSIDVLTNEIGKSLVVTEIARLLNIDEYSEILRFGDSGDIDGNDFELLNSGLGLSVASVSSAKNACWNFLSLQKRGATGMQYYLSELFVESGVARFSDKFINEAYSVSKFQPRLP
jgi:fructoselysine-6-P-deglycase FrlB-like protein/hydroxymethylpyrimidine pyrophosphatase-like HAD family hydrolase